MEEAPLGADRQNKGRLAVAPAGVCRLGVAAR